VWFIANTDCGCGDNGENKMANMIKINKAIKRQFPDLDIEAVRGDGYVYFRGDDGLDVVASIYAHPPVTPTDDMIRMCLANIAAAYPGDRT
jgi:hypothetical protein